MEQQKVLIVIVSVALFVAAVVGIGLIFFYPRAEVSPDAPLRIVQEPSVESRRQFDPIEYLRSPEVGRPEFAPRPPEDDNDLIIVFDDDDPPDPREPRETPEPSVPRDPSPEPAPAPEPREPAPRPPAERPARPAPAPPPPREPEPRQVRVTEYWIQVIASPSRDRVEQARVTLEERGLRGRITTRTVDNTVFYRLRVGGYSERAEAEKFLAWIREIEGFSQSYISEEYPVRTVSR
ncbi:MAG: SPOR domain-containing protein [Spirochaetaceae bacterium]|nr:MAG: SPOR domain-containing protein [Spirochaetaceae bacterium]